MPFCFLSTLRHPLGIRLARHECTTRPDFFMLPSCIRVDLLSYKSKPTDKREQYNWKAEEKLDMHPKKNANGVTFIYNVAFAPGIWLYVRIYIVFNHLSTYVVHQWSECVHHIRFMNIKMLSKKEVHSIDFLPVYFFQQSSRIALIYQTVCSRTISDHQP